MPWQESIETTKTKINNKMDIDSLQPENTKQYQNIREKKSVSFNQPSSYKYKMRKMINDLKEKLKEKKRRFYYWGGK